MRFTRLRIKNFRSISTLDVQLDRRLNVFVGENNVGKSSVVAALQYVLGAALGSPAGVHIDDQRFGGASGSTIVVLDVAMSTPEAAALGLGLNMPEEALRALQSATSGEFLLEASNRGARFTANLGGLTLEGAGITLPGGRVWNSGINNFLQQILLPLKLQDVIRVFGEFRGRPVAGGRTPALESFEGSNTAAVIFNYKNHPDRRLRTLYDDIRGAFAEFFPGLSLEAIEAPGSGQADLQFVSGGHDYAIRLDRVSAGAAQLLTLVANLITRSDTILVVETPELHLHPHARRELHRLLLESSQRNQIIIVTHDVYFAHPPNPLCLVRMAFSDGASAFQLPRELGARELGQISTALKDAGKREMLFARTVVLVEDESQRNVLVGFSRVLGISLDAKSISVISVDGHDAFHPYEVLLRGLSIAYLALRDKPWGSDRAEPMYWSWGAPMELEEYLQQSGLHDLMSEAEQQVGRSKARIAGWVGNHTPPDRIPDLFKRLLGAAGSAADVALQP